MAKINGSKTEQSAHKAAAVVETEETILPEEKAAVAAPEEIVIEALPTVDLQSIDDSLNTLKTLLSAVEKLQKIRQEVGDIKPLLVRMLDGELVSGEELEQLKSGVGGLFRLVRAYSDHQTALAKAQPARSLLDQVLQTPDS